MVKHTLAWVLGAELPVISIGYEVPESPRDSGFTIIYSDAPYRDEVARLTEDELVFVCLGCLLEELPPDVGRGLEIAREHGAARLDDGDVWVPAEVES
jgi:hypothetical protein